jgi:hypothetical protein
MMLLALELWHSIYIKGDPTTVPTFSLEEYLESA